MYFIYNILFKFFFILAIPFLLLKFKKGFLSGIRERFGFINVDRYRNKYILFHASSVGEVITVSPLLRKIRN